MMALLLLLSAAAPDSGNAMLESCQDHGTFSQGLCLGTITGLLDGLSFSPNRYICLPAGTTNGQVRDVVVRYMETHPEERHLRFSMLAFIALVRAFGCPGMSERVRVDRSAGGVFIALPPK